MVLYHLIEGHDDNKPKSGFAIWSTGTNFNGEANTELQSDLDGNFVLYTKTGPATQIALCSSDTNSRSDGNLVIYTKERKPIWATCTDGY